MTGITEQLARLQIRIRAAAEAAGRSPETVKILAVSKRHPPALVNAAVAVGLRDFGENYLQEAVAKMPLVDGDVNWHFIGGIQSNKTRAIAEHFGWVQTVSNSRIARRLSNQRPETAEDLNVLIQVRPLGADSRDGAVGDEVPELADAIHDLPRLILRGLMIIPLPNLGEQQLRDEFARVRHLHAKLRDGGHPVDTLSMGMSADLELAVAEGSTMVRIGTALFGPRQ